MEANNALSSNKSKSNSEIISVATAHDLISKNVPTLLPENIALIKACGRVCAKDIHAPFSLPHFRQTSVDGYAISGLDSKQWKIVGENRAAKEIYRAPLLKGEAVKVYTGSYVPDNASAILMVEYATSQGNILVSSNTPKIGEHIREVGSHVIKDSVIVRQGTRLSAATIGMLAGLGIQNIAVCQRPTVSLIVSGDEIRAAGQDLDIGTVYDSNSFLLRAAVEALSYQIVEPVLFVSDDLAEITNAVKEHSKSSNLVLLSGGMSVGDFDFGAEALDQAGGSKIFHRIAQRPGKPLLMGKVESSIFFGLPGNPVSALVCFYEYVLPAMRRMEGESDPLLRSQKMPLAKKISKQKDLHYFMRGLIENDSVVPLEGQLSYNMLTFSKADVLISIGTGISEFDEGTLVDVHFLP